MRSKNIKRKYKRKKERNNKRSKIEEGSIKERKKEII